MAIILNDNIKINAGKPNDVRYLTTGNTVYLSTDDTNTTIPVPERYTGLTVNILGEEYWYKNGVTDNDLIPKFTLGEFDGITGATNIGYYDGTDNYQRISINVTHKIYGGNLTTEEVEKYKGFYRSDFGYYYRDEFGRIMVGAPTSTTIGSPLIGRRPFIKESGEVKSFVWNLQNNGSTELEGWVLIDGDVRLLVGQEVINIEYYQPDIVAITASTFVSGQTYTVPDATITIDPVIDVVGDGTTVFNQAPVYSRTIIDGTTLEFRTLRSITPNTLNVTYDNAFVNIGTSANNYVTDARNGLYVTGLTLGLASNDEYVVRMGGPLTEPTNITIPVTGASLTITDQRLTTCGILYGGNYESGFQPRSLVTKQYVDNSITGGSQIKSVCILPTTCQSYTVQEGDFFIGARTDNIVGLNTFQTVILPNPTTLPQGMVVVISDYDGFAGIEYAPDSFCCIQISGLIYGGVSDIETKYGTLSYINNGTYWSITGFSPTP